MKVFVTGATGFIGRRLVARLIARGVPVVALARSPRAIPGVQGLEVRAGDLGDRAALGTALAGCDVVVHLANASGVSDPAVVRAVNVTGTANLLEASRAAGVRRFIFTSSISAQRAQLGPYGATKREAEALVRASSIPWVVLRPSLVYGPGGVGLVATLAAYLRGLPLVPVIGNGRIALDPVHLDDVCAVIEQCLERDDVLGHDYDLLGPDRVSFDEFLLRLAREIGVSRPHLHIPGPIAMLMARGFSLITKKPPLSVDNVLGMTSPATVDRAPAARDFPIRWTPLDEGLSAVIHPKPMTPWSPATTGAPAATVAARGAAPRPRVPEVAALATPALPSRSVRVAIVGLGKMGAVHAAVLSMIPEATIVGVNDLSVPLAKSLRGMGFAAPFYPTLEALLSEGKPEAVWVCTPPDSHLAIARACIEKGVSVFVEKPIAHTLADAEAIAALAPVNGAGARVGSGYAQLYMPTFAAADRALAAGAIGNVRSVRSAMYLSQVFAPQRGWIVDPARSGGGVVANLSSHLLAILHRCFGLPVSAKATWRMLYGVVEDEMTATFRLANGADVQFESSWSVPDYPISATFLRAEGEHGTLEVSNETLTLTLDRAAGGWPAGTTRLVHPELPQSARFDLNGDFYWLEDTRFLAWVTGGEAPPATAAAALDVQRMMAALYESAARGGVEVQVPRGTTAGDRRAVMEVSR